MDQAIQMERCGFVAQTETLLAMPHGDLALAVRQTRGGGEAYALAYVRGGRQFPAFLTPEQGLPVEDVEAYCRRVVRGLRRRRKARMTMGRDGTWVEWIRVMEEMGSGEPRLDYGPLFAWLEGCL